MYEALFVAIGGTAGFVALLAYFGKTAIEAYMAGRIETFKADLTVQAANHSAQLERQNLEHSVRFARLHARRAEVIEKLFGLVTALKETMDMTLLVPLEDDESRAACIEHLRKDQAALSDYFAPNRIFLSRQTCQQLYAIIGRAGTVKWTAWQYTLDAGTPRDRAQADLTMHHAQLQNLGREMNNAIAPLLDSLEDEFRALLGQEVASEPAQQ